MNASDLNSKNEKPATPRWETATLALSFVALWVWWLARQNAYKTNSDFSPLWNIGLGIVLALLVWIFVRRLRRTLGAIEELKK